MCQVQETQRLIDRHLNTPLLESLQTHEEDRKLRKMKSNRLPQSEQQRQSELIDLYRTDWHSEGSDITCHR